MKNLDLNELLGNFKATNQLLLSIAEKHNILNAVINNDDCILQDIIDNNNSLIDSFKNHQLNDGWISVDDENNPPPINQDIFVWLTSEYQNRGDSVHGVATDKFFDDDDYKGFGFEYHNNSLKENKIFVTHWQYLPNPPQE